MIIVQTPLRISLFGGGTDLPDYFMSEGGCVLNFAIDKYIFINIKKRFDDLIRIGYTETEMVESVGEINHELIREAFRKTGISNGVEITTMGDIPSAGSGLGSSSTVTVGALHAMYAYLGDIVPTERLAREACEIEIDILEKPIGYQDQFIAAYGGLRVLEFCPDGTVSIEKLDVNGSISRAISQNLLLFYTGKSRSAGSILSEQKGNIRKRRETLRSMKEMVQIARDELVNGNFDTIGLLLNDSWQLKKQLASRISDADIDMLYERSMKAGALGGKITGAGGGGFLLLYCCPEYQDQLRNELSDLQELPFNLEPDGSKVIFNYRR